MAQFSQLVHSCSIALLVSCGILIADETKPHITVVGTGYVGLVTGAGLAEIGNRITCADISKEKIEALKNGLIPIFEPGLNELVSRNVEAGRLDFTNNVDEAIAQADVIFIAVGTPMGDDGSADLAAVKAVTHSVASHMNKHKIICTKSTVPVGTGAWIAQLLKEKDINSDMFDVVSNPEFLREGSAVQDFLHPDRIVIGTESDEAREIMASIYAPMEAEGIQILFTNIPTSETIKYASNAFLATKISYINEVANFCKAVGANVYEVAKGMGMDKRIGALFLNPGPGFGGSCFPKDCHALVHMADDHEVSVRVIKAALKANEYQKKLAAHKLSKIMGSLEGKTVAILGLAFKANTDDVRYSPSITTIQTLLDQGAKIKAFDPVAQQNMQFIFPLGTIEYVDSISAALENADACIIMTEWPEFKSLDLESMGTIMKQRILIDMRGMIDPGHARQAGFIFDGFGRMSLRSILSGFYID